MEHTHHGGLTAVETEEVLGFLQASRDHFAASLAEHEKRLRLIGDCLPGKAPPYQALVAAYRACVACLNNHVVQVESYLARRREQAEQKRAEVWSTQDILDHAG